MKQTRTPLPMSRQVGSRHMQQHQQGLHHQRMSAAQEQQGRSAVSKRRGNVKGMRLQLQARCRACGAQQGACAATPAGGQGRMRGPLR